MVLRWRAVTCTCKCLMHDFSLIMIQVQIVSVSVDVQQSTPIFQPNNVQCILINPIMLFVFSWPVLLHSNVMLKCTNLQTCLVSTCQIYELTRQCRLQNSLKGKMFLKHYFVINDFSDIVFKKRFIPHMEVFFSIRTLDS